MTEDRKKTGHLAPPPALPTASPAKFVAGYDYYIDPKTGYFVWTEGFLQRRGYCCESGCRHCPFGFKKS